MGVCFSFIAENASLQPLMLIRCRIVWDLGSGVLGSTDLLRSAFLEIEEVFTFLNTLKERISSQSDVWICLLDVRDVL